MMMSPGDVRHDGLPVGHRRGHLGPGHQVLDHQEGDEAPLGRQVEGVCMFDERLGLSCPREVITRHVKNRGDSYTVENLFGETENRDCQQQNKKQDNQDRKAKRKKPARARLS